LSIFKELNSPIFLKKNQIKVDLKENKKKEKRKGEREK